MALGFATNLRNARADAISTFTGGSALLRIYDGSRPATGGTATTLLAELTCNATIAASASGGVLTLNSITQDSSANATGTATWFRMVKSDGTTHVMDGDVGTSGSDLNLNTTSIVSGGPVAVTSFVITEGNAYVGDILDRQFVADMAAAEALSTIAKRDKARAAAWAALLARIDASLPVDPPPVDPPPTPVPSLGPFVGGAWNTAVQVTPDAARTAAFRAGGRLWLNSNSNSHPIYRAKDSDPLVTFTDTVHGGDPSWPGVKTIQWRCPTTAAAAPGDGHLHIISPDGTKVLETIAASKTAAGWNVGRMHVVDLSGTGMGPMNGTRAYGGSGIGGLITNADIATGKIAHPLAVALPNSLLLYTGGKAGYDSRGYGTALGYIAPATEQDYDSQWLYKGTIPMGTRLSIPADADLSGLIPEVRMVGQALKDFGGMVVDRCGDGDICFYAEPSAPSSWVSALLGPNWGRNELMKLMPLIQVA